MENQMFVLGLNLNLALLALFFLVISTGFMVGCSSAPKRIKVARDSVEEAYELQKPIVVNNSKKDGRPDWTKKTSYEEEGHVCFSGGFMNGSDYSVTVRCANAEALKAAVQAVSQFIRVEFSEYVHGPNTGSGGVDRYVEDGIATFVESLHLQGIRQTEIFYEELFSASIAKPTFNVWVRLEIGKADFLKAKADAIRKLRDRFSRTGELEAKEKAERLLEELKRGGHNEARRGA